MPALAAALLLACLSSMMVASPAQAKSRINLVHEFCGERYCGFHVAARPVVRKRFVQLRYAKRSYVRHRRAPKTAPANIAIAQRPTIAGYAASIARSTKLSDLTSGLAVKVRQIVSVCGARLVSGYRRGARVNGSGRPSLHSAYPSQAADMTGNPGCIYALLKGWPGGYSTDYRAVRHVHISLGRRERGMRFVHSRRVRYAVAQ